MKPEVTGNSHHHHAQGEPRLRDHDTQLSEGQSLPTRTFTDILQAIRAACDEQLAQKIFSRCRISESGCWEWQGARSGDGYGTVRVGLRTIGVHRVAFALVHGAPRKQLHVCHRCDNPICINPSHLFAGTPADNVHDTIAKGRRSARCPRTRVKLSAAQVVEIRDRHARTHERYSDIAKDYSVKAKAIGRVIRREAWANIS